MTLPVLADDALSTGDQSFALRLSLPWIRSLPLASLHDVRVSIDGADVAVRVRLDGRDLSAADLATAPGWWFVQDRVALAGDTALPGGAHDVAVSFRLLIPYLPAGPDAPLVLPFAARRRLVAGPDGGAHDARAVRLSATPRPPEPARAARPAPSAWRLAASAFNWTPEVIRAERDAADIAVGIAAGGTADEIEVELGQSLRSFPALAGDEAAHLGWRIADGGGRVSIVGASLDDWLSPSRRRGDDERLAFLLPQLHAAHALGAEGVRLPIGQAGEPLLRRLLPTLHELDLVLYEEVQGPQTPAREEAAIDAVARIDDAHVRLLVDISMLMPALPVTYLERMAALPADLHARLGGAWRDPATHDAVLAALRAGDVPREVHTMFMDLLVRFGRSEASELRPVLPLVGAFHLKFWDLEDADGRVSGPIRDLGDLLRGTGFAGTLCSEWGGHEWLDADPTETTSAHLALAREALG
ncbi:hypothetical protein [Microbacterium gilvum]|uniref:Uncharacterized protein n=1 Tax=Microbacterium gilvum TaxID=1336204 RepID=A0ABP9ANU7_9MICO